MHLIYIGFMVLNATFKNISVISWGQLYWWRKPEDKKKTTDKLYHIMLQDSVCSGFEMTTSVVFITNQLLYFLSMIFKCKCFQIDLVVCLIDCNTSYLACERIREIYTVMYMIFLQTLDILQLRLPAVLKLHQNQHQFQYISTMAQNLLCQVTIPHIFQTKFKKVKHATPRNK